jgi:hypothetical protein
MTMPVQRPEENAPGVWAFRTTMPRLLLLVLIAAALLLPIWLVRYPPLLDYPNHLARSFVLYHLNDPAYHFRGFYRAEWGPYPYLGMDLALIALQRVFSAEIAGKLLLSLCVLGVPLSVWWFIRQASPGHDALAFWGLLLPYNLFFLEGFISFQIGLAFCFLTVGLWLRYLKLPSRNRWLAVLALATATYFVHLIAFGLTGFIILVYTVADRRPWRDVILAGTLFLPGVLFFSLSGIGRHNGADLHFRTWQEKYSDGVAALLHGYSSHLEAIAFYVILACLVLAWVRNSEFRIQRQWVWVLAGLLLLYCAMPDGLGESWDVDVRAVPALFVVLLAMAALGRRERLLAAVALLLFTARTVDVTRNFVAKQADLSVMARAIDILPRNTRLLPLINVIFDDPIERLYPHFWAYSIIERGALAPGLFDLPGQTALRITGDIYTPDLPPEDPLDWGDLRDDYDYVWVYDFPQLTPEFAVRSTVVYVGGDLRLYRLPGPAGE